jgi:hypothetical protein
MSGRPQGGLWRPGGPSPIRRDRPITCAVVAAVREWLGVSQKRYCGTLELGPHAWALVCRAAVGQDFPGGSPLIAAPYALALRWMAARQVWLPAFHRPDPAELWSELQCIPGLQVPSRRLVALALGRDAGAAGAWFRPQNPGGADSIIGLACALLLCGPHTQLAGRWRAWLRMAQREAQLRGIPSLEEAGSWRTDGVLVLPPGRWRL